MIDYVLLVKKFHDKYKHYIQDRPSAPSNKVIELRYKLIEEELMETLGALRELMNDPYQNLESIVELADGIADSIVVLLGTAISFGIPIDEVFEEVMRSNMTKSTEKNDYGKTIKGLEYEPPKIREIIMKRMK